MWHDDFGEASACRAYTMMVPLQAMGHSDCHLAWKDVSGAQHVYRYAEGKAILFGSGFTHSTQPLHEHHDPHCSPAVFLCFNFGTSQCGAAWGDIYGSLPLGSPSFTELRKSQLGVTPAPDATPSTDVELEIMAADPDVATGVVVQALRDAVPSVKWEDEIGLEPVGFGINCIVVQCSVPFEMTQDEFMGAVGNMALLQHAAIRRWQQNEPVCTTFKDA